MIASLKAMLIDRGGATLVEYALVLTLILIITIVSLQILGHYSSHVLSSAATSI